uniref:Uncharacterized protein n=1 Tax=Strix occidentalis caurina TaxID=311401 RepID=A0A8D0F2C9_STROC
MLMSRLHPTSPLWGEQWGCLCPVLQMGALPSPREDAQGWGLLCQQRCLSFTVAVVAGVMLMAGICPTQRPQQASALIPSRLSP